MLLEGNTYGQEGINAKIAELTQQRDIKVKQKNRLVNEIKFLNAEIKKWSDEISPNQTTMF